MNDQMQEGFEAEYGIAWLDSAPACIRWSLAWQASRAALVVELPGLTGLDQQFTGTPISEIRAHNHYNKAISLCRTAIQSAGVSVK
jgi:hypothetical protein